MGPVGSSQYTQALEFLFARTTGGVRFGLERTIALLEGLGNPHTKVPCFHVAGTNGKGSTVAMLAALLRHKGLRVATYTSPHLIDFRERIVVDGTAISEDEVVRFIQDHTARIEHLGATFFEATTALAFDHIARSGADVAVIETGLGGRLDSTNVVTPLAAVVTSIALDHMDLLGDTVEAIALEKAGIFKRGRPAVCGWIWPNVETELESAARAAGVSSIRFLEREVDFSWIDTRANSPTPPAKKWNAPDWTGFQAAVHGQTIETRIGLIGTHQAHNAMTAWLTLDAAGPPYAVPLSSIEPALGQLTIPGRFQRVGNLLFDVAHNPDGLGPILQQFKGLNPPRPSLALVGILSDKDWRAMLPMIGEVVDEIVATIPPTAPAERRWHLDEVAAFASDNRITLRAIPDFDEALRVATENPGAALITGSFHTVGDAMARLHVNPLAR